MNWTLFPATANARDVATLWWTMLGVAAVVWLAVTVAAIMSVRRGRATAPETDAPYLGPESPRTRMALLVAGLLTVGVLFFFMGYDFVLGRRTPQHQHQNALTVTVNSRQWWWEFIYEDTVPGKRMSTANELHVPVGVPVNLVLESPDVIHSAWIPRLGGKQDLVPGYRGSLVFTADTAGIYSGVCAEFCGAQHANMRFIVVAQERKDFEDWYALQRGPQPQPTDSILVAGQRAFLSGSCATCHTIAGTPAAATRGPNLTHVGSRRILAAGAIPNTHDDMLRWIYNPQSVKPGTYMPPSNLPPETLQPLVAYLRSLK